MKFMKAEFQEFPADYEIHELAEFQEFPTKRVIRISGWILNLLLVTNSWIYIRYKYEILMNFIQIY